MKKKKQEQKKIFFTPHLVKQLNIKKKHKYILCLKKIKFNLEFIYLNYFKSD